MKPVFYIMIMSIGIWIAIIACIKGEWWVVGVSLFAAVGWFLAAYNAGGDRSGNVVGCGDDS